MNTEKNKNVIIGLVKNYDFEVLRPFLTTLRNTGYTGDVVFFYSTIDAKTITKLAHWGVKLVPFDTTFPYLENSLATHNKWQAYEQTHTLVIHCLRYLLAYCYLKEYGNHYKNVLLSDTRDVIFQKDPFDMPIGDNVCCFTERDGFVIADSLDDTAKWVEKGFGKDALARVSQKPIICSGVTIGATERIVQYLEIFMDTIVQRNVNVTITGMDQGIHNYLIYEHLLPAVVLYKNSDGPVLTLGLEDKVTRTQGIIVNARGQVPNIVHQYDRHWSVAKHYYSARFIVRHYVAVARGLLSAFLRTHAPRLYHMSIYVLHFVLGRSRAHTL